MKNKIISLIIVFSFMACILCTPIHIFFQNFYSAGLSFEKADIKGFSKNIVLSAGKIAQFDDFTQNIKTAKKKIFDFSGISALFSKAEKQKFIPVEKAENFKSLKTVDFANTFYFADTDRHRLRMCTSTENIWLIFMFFILIYIGMLRAVYVNKNISLLNIEKPLFT